MLSLNRRILALSLLAVGGVLALLLWWSPRPAAPPALPSPNGYDDLLRAAAAHQGKIDAPQASTEELRGFVENNREALRLVRVGLSRACQVPVEYSQAYMVKHLKELADTKALAQALKAEGALAERENRLSDAVNSYLDTMRLGHQAARGGLLIDQLVGLACQAIGLNPLMNLRTNLSAQDWRGVIQTLEAIEREQEPLPAMLARERDWGRRVIGVKYLRYRVLAHLRQTLEQPYEKFRRKVQNLSARRRLLLAEAAVRCFWLENHRYPDSLRELVPGLLGAVPVDPYTETGLIYRPQTGAFLLYSTGPDGKDDGGTPISKGSAPYPPKGDIFLDSPWP
jgi:hypothetical protein